MGVSMCDQCATLRVSHPTENAKSFAIVVPEEFSLIWSIDAAVRTNVVMGAHYLSASVLRPVVATTADGAELCTVLVSDAGEFVTRGGRAYNWRDPSSPPP
jgi:hypothetical protein